MKDLFVRQFEENDADAIYKLHIAGLEETDSLIGGRMRKTLDQDLQNVKRAYIQNGGEFLVVIKNNKIIGMGGLKRTSESTAEIKRMRVASELQGKGIGKLILDNLIEKAKSLGYKKLILDTSIKQTRAHGLYESRGFKEYKRGDIYGQETIYYSKDI